MALTTAELLTIKTLLHKPGEELLCSLTADTVLELLIEQSTCNDLPVDPELMPENVIVFRPEWSVL